MMKQSKTIRIAIIVIWVLLFALLLKRELFIPEVSSIQDQALLQAEREEYQGIYFRRDKIGYVISRYIPDEEGGLRIDQQAHMNLHVADMVHTVDLHLQAALSETNTLKNFSFRFTSPFYTMAAQGHTEGTSVLFTLTTGNNTIEDRVELDAPPMVPTVRRSYLLQPLPAIGDKRRLPWFDPMGLTAKNSIVEYRGKERVHIQGRVHNLHWFIENYGGARINLWLNDEGEVMREESPAGFIFLREPKFKALSLAEPSEELLSAVSVPVTGVMPDLQGLTSIQYKLGLPEGDSFQLHSGRQSFSEIDALLTLSLEPPITADERLQVPRCEGGVDYLLSTPYIQADAKKIEEQAKSIVGENPANANSSTRAISRISDWVYTHIEKRPVLGIPDALTTLDTLRGDCNEHAALFAALARNRGIPTKIAAGVVFHKGAFYYHAWNEVCVGRRWVSIDTTTRQFPADLSHIKFIEGGLHEQVRIGALLGRLTIEPLLLKQEKP